MRMSHPEAVARARLPRLSRGPRGPVGPAVGYAAMGEATKEARRSRS
jgi:hypothetical protein